MGYHWPPASRNAPVSTCLRASFVLALTLALIHVAHAINFDIAPGKEECFFEEVHQGTQIKGAYAVTQGSHMDIDVQIFNPRNNVIFNAKRDGEGKFQMKADSDGTFRFCFSNKMSTISHKTVKLIITTGEPLDLSKLAKKESMDNVERWIVSISHTVRMIDFHQQEYRLLHERHLKSKLPGPVFFCLFSRIRFLTVPPFVCSHASQLSRAQTRKSRFGPLSSAWPSWAYPASKYSLSRECSASTRQASKGWFNLSQNLAEAVEETLRIFLYVEYIKLEGCAHSSAAIEVFTAARPTTFLRAAFAAASVSSTDFAT